MNVLLFRWLLHTWSAGRFPALVFSALMLSVAVATSAPAVEHTGIDHERLDQALAAASDALNQGHFRASIDSLIALLRSIDPAADRAAYLKVSTSLIDLLNQVEAPEGAAQVIDNLLSSQIHLSEPSALPSIQYRLARNLARLGKRDESQKLLQTLTAGDERFVHNDIERGAAMMLSDMARDRQDYVQSDIWMRRAVIGTEAMAIAPVEMIDVLTQYATHLANTRRLIEANTLFGKLEPVYSRHFDWHGPKYLNFASHYLSNLIALGLFQAADVMLRRLNSIVADVDIVADSVKKELFIQNLYSAARGHVVPGERPIADRLEQIVRDFPDFSRQPENRIRFTYFALLSGNIGLAEQIYAAGTAVSPADLQFAAYDVLLKAFFRAYRGQVAESIELLRDGLGRISQFHQITEVDSSRHLPALRYEERVVLGSILALNAAKITRFEQADILFQVQQYLNRDQGKLGLNRRAAQAAADSGLTREELRSRDRLLEVRDRLMEDATTTLLDRIESIQASTPGSTTDFTRLARLEDVEDRIARYDEEFSTTIKVAADTPINLASIQKLLRPNEALVLHAFSGTGAVVTACVDSRYWMFNVRGFDATGATALASDVNSLIEAVHQTYPPSPSMDAKFPADISYRLYGTLLDGVEPCLRHKTHLFLATHPDLFTLPWNALLTMPPKQDQPFLLRDAAWLPKTYALSLLPSVVSLDQLRSKLSASRARRPFLGVGAPKLAGAPEPRQEISLASVFVAKGIANRAAIADLDALPETADELHEVARIMGATDSDVLLGAQATERELRGKPLNDYRVISFATHALVAGDIEGVTEPALVLTPGDGEYRVKNDGLLTASEVENLTLDANLVILSACNTAASDGRASGRGLSGFADSFFLAGTRSLAVTQWEVGSEEAKRLGAGLIAHAAGSQNSGVAEGLRLSMLDYISQAPRDYLANPRFWAPFMIAGDGAVRPETADASVADTHDAIKLDGEAAARGDEQSEIHGLTKVGPAVFALGVLQPPAGEKRAGSYLAEIKADASIGVIDRAPGLAASKLVALDGDLGVLGEVAASHGTSAVFRLLDTQGQEKWRYVENAAHWNHPVGAVKVAAGTDFLSTDTDFSPGAGGTTLILTQLSRTGQAITQRRYPLPVAVGLNGLGSAVVAPDGTLTVALPGQWLENPAKQQGMWINPATGSKRFCIGNRSASVLVSIDAVTLELRLQRIIPDDRLVSLRRRDGHLYAAADVAYHCRVETTVKLLEISPEFDIKKLFETNNVNSLEVSDFEVAQDYFVLVGRLMTFMPDTVTPSPIEPAKFVDDWKDSFWEHFEVERSMFIMVVAADGTLRYDRVFPGAARNAVSNLVAAGPDHFTIAGATVGERGWVMSFGVH